jgi:tetratricopeptide (TPR) repeat protein
MPAGTGAISIPLGGDWQPSKLFLYDKGTRPVIQLANKQPGLELSYVIFPNGSEAPTAESCREDVIGPLLKRFPGEISTKSVRRAEMTSANGSHIATVSYLFKTASEQMSEIAGVKLQQTNVLGFYGDKNICAEVHVSQTSDKPIDPSSLDEELKTFTALPGYVPTAANLAALASVFYRNMKDYPSAAVYYDSALRLLPTPSDAKQKNVLRFLTDQASMSYGISGDLKKSRALNEAAILKDPDYPLYYYNLACADAESGDALAARTHLQQAFDRRANTLPGEHLPDPSTDDSILKLKKDASFWSFVQSLPKT